MTSNEFPDPPPPGDGRDPEQREEQRPEYQAIRPGDPGYANQPGSNQPEPGRPASASYPPRPNASQPTGQSDRAYPPAPHQPTDSRTNRAIAPDTARLEWPAGAVRAAGARQLWTGRLGPVRLRRLRPAGAPRLWPAGVAQRARRAQPDPSTRRAAVGLALVAALVGGGVGGGIVAIADHDNGKSVNSGMRVTNSAGVQPAQLNGTMGAAAAKIRPSVVTIKVSGAQGRHRLRRGHQDDGTS